jgi:hypothetical protein
MDQSKTKLGVTSEFLSQMGRFHGIWSSIELNIDYAVGKFLGVPHEEAHLITAGTDFNRKVRAPASSCEAKKSAALKRYSKCAEYNSE